MASQVVVEIFRTNASQNASRSFGDRLVIRLPSTATSGTR